MYEFIRVGKLSALFLWALKSVNRNFRIFLHFFFVKIWSEK